MKAKQYAELIASAADEHVTMVETLDSLAKSALETAKTRASLPAMMGCIREAFTKWKSIVAHTTALKPECSIFNELFPKYLSYLSPSFFAIAMEQKVFLGYTPDSQDVATAREGRDRLENIALKERMASLQKEAQRMGLPGF